MHKELRVELGRTWVRAEDVARLDVGGVIELDTLSDEVVDVLVDGRLIARGTPAVLDGQLCVRIWEVIGPADAADGREEHVEGARADEPEGVGTTAR